MRIERVILLATFAQLTTATYLISPAYNCFNRTADVGIDGQYRPLAELYFVTPEECMLWCINQAGAETGALCNSVVFHRYEQTCSTYAQGGVSSTATETAASPNRLPGMIVRAHGHDWYNRISTTGATGNCSSPAFSTTTIAVSTTTAAPTTTTVAPTTTTIRTTTTTTITTTTAFPIFRCPAGTKSEYVLYTGVFSQQSPENQVTVNLNEVACARACDRGRLQIGSEIVPIDCQAFVLRPRLDPNCILLKKKAMPAGPAAFTVPDNESLYVEKICVDENASCSNGNRLSPMVASPGQWPSAQPTQIVHIFEQHALTPIEALTDGNCASACIKDGNCEGYSFVFSPPDSNIGGECRLFSTADGLVPSNDPTQVFVESPCRRVVDVGDDANECPAGQTGVWLVSFFDEVTVRPGASTGEFSVASEIECGRACRASQVPGGARVPGRCTALHYTPPNNNAGARCKLYSDRIPPNGLNAVTPGAATSRLYAEPVCVSTTRSDCRLFNIRSAHAPAGTAYATSTQLNSDACLQACISDTDNCGAATFRANAATNNCQLFRETLANTIAAPGAISFENGCRLQSATLAQLTAFVARGRARAAVQRNVLQFNNENSILPAPLSTHWSQWSACQYEVSGVKVRVRTMSDCADSNCGAGEMQVQRC